MKTRDEIEFLIAIWEATPNDVFKDIIRSLGWKCLSPVSIKDTFYKDSIVMKFDADSSIGRTSHTGNEYEQWVRAKPNKRRYMVRPIAYKNGLLFQPMLDTFCGLRCYCPDDVRQIAGELRISDWFNHGYLNGKLKFVDTDSQGSGWYSYKKRHKNERSSKHV